MKNQNTDSFNKPQRLQLMIAAIACLVAIGIHGYLVNLHFTFKYGQRTGASICNVGAKFNCEAVTASSYSEFLGVPMALWGILANVLLLGYLAWALIVESEAQRKSKPNLRLIATVILLGSLVMGAISIAFLSQWCLFCIFTYLLSFVTFGCVWIATSSKSPVSSASALLSQDSLIKRLSPSLVAGAVVFFLGFVVSGNVDRNYSRKLLQAEDMGGFVRDVVNEWAQLPGREIRTGQGLTLNSELANPLMTIVEFADFTCIHCKHAAPTLHAFALGNSNDVKFTFQPWPRDGECNKEVPSSNGVACGLARAVYCSDKQGQGWKAHDWVFENMERFSTKQSIEEKLPELAKEVGVDPGQLTTCWTSDDAKRAMEMVSEIGNEVKIKGTPTIFVNGKVLTAGQMLPVLKAAHEHLKKQKK